MDVFGLVDNGVGVLLIFGDWLYCFGDHNGALSFRGLSFCFGGGGFSNIIEGWLLSISSSLLKKCSWAFSSNPSNKKQIVIKIYNLYFL